MTTKTRKTAKRMREWLLLAVIVMTVALSLTGCAAGHPAAEKSTTQEAQPENDAPVLTEGETVSIDGMCEFRMDYVTITDHPEHYFEPYAGRTCVDFCITYEHLADYVISEGNVMEGKLIYSGQYEYDGVDMVKEEEGDSLRHAHGDIKPSEVRQMHYFFTVPEEVQDSGRMVELSMKIRGNDYRVIVREGSRGTVSGDGNDGASNKASGALSDGEAVVTEHAVFYVENAEFTKKVTPPNPGIAYRYYAAEDGKTFVDFCIAYKNTSNQKIIANKAVSAKLKQAEAETSVAEEANRSQFDYANLVPILPLCTEYIHFVFQIPEEVEDSGEQLTITLKIDGNRYTYDIQ